MNAVARVLSSTLLLGLLGAQMQCTFPTDWEFGATQGAGGNGTAGGGMGGAAGGGTCASPFDDCDGVEVNGCETNLLTDSLNCGQCDNICTGNSPACTNGVCSQGCAPDADEPNDVLQAPLPPPMPMEMRVFDETDNDFKVSDGRTATLTPSFTSDGDVDVYYLHVTDDLPLPMGTTQKGSGFSITLSQVPSGATYSITSYFFCDDGSGMVGIFNTSPEACPVGTATTGFIGNWWHCQQYVDSPGLMYTYGETCDTTGVSSGILQIEVKVIGGPAQPTCAPYTLSVNVFQIAI